MLDELNKQQVEEPKKEVEWSGIINKLEFPLSTIGQLVISTNDKSFNFKTLLQVVVDKSGSMSGGPMKHCHYSLHRMMDLTYKNPDLITTVITYNDTASSFVVNTAQDILLSKSNINNINAGGGTSFSAAFKEIVNVCNNNMNNDLISSMVIVFLTDGEDSSVSGPKRVELVDTLKSSIQNIWKKPYTIHTVGFGDSHDYNFLDKLRQIGTTEGAFRFAKSGEDSDSLSGKINSILDVIAETSSVPIKLKTNHISADGNKFWLNLSNHKDNTFPIEFIVNDKDEFKINATFSEQVNDQKTMDAYVSMLIDNIASELLVLSSKPDSIEKQLHCELLQQRSKAILVRLDIDSNNHNRLTNLLDNLKTVQKGESINQKKLNDMRFEGKFATQYNQSSQTTHTQPAILPKPQVYKNNYWNKINKPAIKRCYANKKCAKIFRVIGQYSTLAACDWLRTNYTLEYDQNNADPLTVASGLGRVDLVQTILTHNKSEHFNKRGYNAVDMAILYGYTRTAEILLDNGFRPSIDNLNLFQTCLLNGYTNTAKLMIDYKLVHITNDTVDSAPNSYIRKTYTTIADWLSNYLTDIPIETQILKGMFDKVKDKVNTITKLNLKDYVEMFAKSSPDQLQVIKLLVDNKKLNPVDHINIDDDISWPLFVAAEKGNLELVKLLLPYMSVEDVNKQNLKGTTALWIATCNKHIDIVTELLNIGADPNICNFKGDGPLIPACQKGLLQLVELLLMCGASLTAYNKNRDNPVLICCRTGQDKILEKLLETFDKDELKKVLETFAEIDGFVPLLAATELDKVECIKVCAKYGADLEIKTSPDNNIIKSATAIHLACFYNRLKSLDTLVKLGGSLTSKTEEGYTPLHVAIKQNHPMIVKYLLSNPTAKDCLNIKDNDNKTPMYYANEEMMAEFFTNNLAIVLNMAMYDKDCSNVLVNYGQSLGFFENADITNITYNNGSSILSEAMLRNNANMVECLLKLGADIHKEDDYGVTPDFWAAYLSKAKTENPQTMKLIENVEKLKSNGLQNKMLLSLTPNTSKAIEYKIDSYNRMSNSYPDNVNSGIVDTIKKESEKSITILGFIEKLKNNKVFPEGKDYLEYLLWDAKINIIKKIATNTNNNMQPIHLLALYLFSSNDTIFNNTNEGIVKYSHDNVWNPYIYCLYQAVSLSPVTTNEVYRGVNIPFVHTNYNIGDTLVWNTFTMCSEEWKNVGELLKSKQGIVFIINSKTGRDVSLYCKNPQNRDVIFLPGSKFVITNFYKPDIICLGQKNIRQSTFKITPEQIARLSNIIIEIEETD